MALAGPDTRLILLESPGSLTFEIQDVPAIARLAKERGIVTVIDNTWGVGLLYEPLALGVDVSVQALTKYVGGHSDVFMGAACSNDARLLDKIDAYLRDAGIGVSPDDAYFMLRGLRTLDVRLARHGENALTVAGWPANSRAGGASQVLCPALPSAPGHDLVEARLQGRLNGLFGVVLRPGSEAGVEAFSSTRFRPCSAWASLGAATRAWRSTAIRSLQARRAAQPYFGGPLVRLHVGLEDPDDLIADLRGALDAYAPPEPARLPTDPGPVRALTFSAKIGRRRFHRCPHIRSANRCRRSGTGGSGQAAPPPRPWVGRQGRAKAIGSAPPAHLQVLGPVHRQHRDLPGCAGRGQVVTQEEMHPLELVGQRGRLVRRNGLSGSQRQDHPVRRQQLHLRRAVRRQALSDQYGDRLERPGCDRPHARRHAGHLQGLHRGGRARLHGQPGNCAGHGAGLSLHPEAAAARQGLGRRGAAKLPRPWTPPTRAIRRC